MLLFSGALFIMMAGTIRAVTILTVSRITSTKGLLLTNTRLVQMAQSQEVNGHVAKPLSQ